GYPRKLQLLGYGVSPPLLTISPPRFNFGQVPVGKQSREEVFTITNPGASALTLGAPSTVGSYKLVSTSCASQLAVNESCTARVVFAPMVAGPLRGSLAVPVVTSGASPAPPAAELFGIGVLEARLEAPAHIDLGTFLLGSSAPLHREVTLRNVGNAIATLTSISVSNPFTLVNHCPYNLAPNTSCTLTLEFSSGIPGEFNGALTIVSNAPGGSHAIAVKARAQLVAHPSLRVSPTYIGFGGRLIGTQSASQRLTVTNDGGTVVAITGLRASADFVLVSSDCPQALAPQASCSAEVAMRPLGFGTRLGRLLINSNAVAGRHWVDLAGSGCRPFHIAGNRSGRSHCSP
ncbi:MAG TPA: choice-of-anchor D domain-containing protein, partial [Usitatibacter sp.]|nr:choice-of-anchor D domain-containing protein [Usitatibacter sp.]